MVGKMGAARIELEFDLGTMFSASGTMLGTMFSGPSSLRKALPRLVLRATADDRDDVFFFL